MIGQALITQHVAVIIHTRPHAAQAQGYIFHAFKRFNGRVNPCFNRNTFDCTAIDKAATAPGRGLLHHDNTQPGLARDTRSVKPGNTPADNHQIRKRVEMLIPVWIFLFRRRTKTRRLPDERFKHVLPERTRMDERLVVEPCGQEARDSCVHRSNIIIERRPVVLAFCTQALKKLSCGGPCIGLHLRILPKRNQRVCFFGTGRNDRSWAMVFERTPHQHLIIGQKRRGQRIAAMTGETFAIEGELHTAVAVDQSTTCGETGAHVQPSQSGRFFLILLISAFGGAVTCAGYVPKTSSVEVHRAAWNHFPHPFTCRQRSK